MSTASSSSSRQVSQVVGKCKRSGTCEFRLENTRARNPVFFWVKWLPWSPKEVSVSAISRVDRGKLSTKSAQDCSDSSIST